MTILAVDSHVHMYPCYDPETFIESAIKALRTDNGTVPTLFLTERARESFFPDLKAGKYNLTVRQTAEADSLFVDDGLLLINGKQIISSERVEVLAVGMSADIADGAPIEETLDKIEANDGVAVLPWGVDKWLGKRGDCVSAVAEKRKILLAI